MNRFALTAIEKIMGKDLYAKTSKTFSTYLFINDFIKGLLVDDVIYEVLPYYDRDKALVLAAHYAVLSRSGDIVEFGTAKGITASIIAKAMRAAGQGLVGPKPILHLFDSFEGLPEINSSVDQRSFHVECGEWYKGSCLGISAQELEQRIGSLIGYDRVKIYAGWFADTISRLDDSTRFSMIHFDGDLYQSCMDALWPCFERGLVSPGAILLFDDWNCNRASSSVGERRAFAELVEAHQIEYDDRGEHSWHGHSFFIQNYKNMPAQ